MKKRLLITSIVMMLVVAVALGTSTYAWFTSNTSVKASDISLRAQVSGSSSLGIGWIDGEAGTAITFSNFDVLNPMAPDTLIVGTTTSDVLFKSATIKQEDSVEMFNGDAATSYTVFTTTVGTTDVTGKYVNDGGVYKVTTDSVAQSGTTYYTKNFAPIVFKNSTGTQEFYVRNLSGTNDIGTITLTANFANSNAYILTKDATFQQGVTYYTSDGQETPTYTEAPVTVGNEVTANTYYEKVTGDDMIRVAIFTKNAYNYKNSSASGNYTLLGVLGKTESTPTKLTTGATFDKNTTYYVKDGDNYVQTVIADADAFAPYVTSGNAKFETLYTIANTAAYTYNAEGATAAAQNMIQLNDAVKDLGYYTNVAPSLTLTSSLEANNQIDIVAIVWLDGTVLTDARAGELGQVSFTFQVGTGA